MVWTSGDMICPGYHCQDVCRLCRLSQESCGATPTQQLDCIGTRFTLIHFQYKGHFWESILQSFIHQAMSNVTIGICNVIVYMYYKIFSVGGSQKESLCVVQRRDSNVK